MAKQGWGYCTEESEKSKIVWGARAIVEGESFSLLCDRQGAFVENEEDRSLLGKCLNEAMPRVHREVQRLRDKYEMRPDEAKEFVLFENEKWKFVGNTNASYGYLYLVGFLKNEK